MNRGLCFIVFLLLCFSWLLPHHYPPWMSALQDAAAIAAILLLAMAWAVVGRLKLSAITFFFLIVLPIPLVQAATRKLWFWGDAWVAFLYLLVFCLAFLIGFNSKSKAEQPSPLLSALFACIIIGACLSVILAARQWLLLPAGVWSLDIVSSRPSANMAQPNNYASLACMAFFGVLYFFERKLIGVVASSLLALFLLFGITLAQSRTSWVVSLFFLFFFLYKSRVISFRMSVRYLAVGTGVYIAFILIMPVVSDVLLLSSADLADRVKSTARWDLYRMFTSAILDGGLWGYGWNQVAVAHLAVAQDYPLGMRVAQSHNLLLDIFLWNGPIIGGVIVFVLGAWLARLCQRIETPPAFYGLMAFFCLLIHGMLEFPLEYAFFLMPAGLLLGCVSSEVDKPVGVIPRWLWPTMVVVASGLGGRVIYEYVQLEDEYRQVRMESVRVVPKDDHRLLPKTLILDQLGAMVQVFRMNVQGGLTSDELDFIRKTAHRYPNHYLLNFYALTLVANGCRDHAFEQVELIKAIHGQAQYDVTRELVDERSGATEKNLKCPQKTQS